MESINQLIEELNNDGVSVELVETNAEGIVDVLATQCTGSCGGHCGQCGNSQCS